MTLSPLRAASDEQLTVSAVIVNWNTCDLLDACLRSLRSWADEGIEVVVVDNGSSDGSRELLAQAWPEVRVIANAENRGYQTANNQGMRAATGDVLLLINADAMLTAGCLDGLIERLRRDPEAAVVGPRLVYGDGTFQRWTAGRLPTLRAAVSYFFFIDHVLPRSSLWLGADVREAFAPGWVSSACMVVRRCALDDVGFMDERFFAYMDDVDLCARMGAAGWTVWYEPSVTAVHLMGQSTKRQTGAASPHALSSYVRWYGMHHGRLALSIFRVVAACGFGLRSLLYTLSSGRRPHARAAARAHARNARQVLRPTPKERS
jgi:GT2 family glycosyltransferase